MRSKLANPRATTRSRTVVTLIAAMLAAMSLAVGEFPRSGPIHRTASRPISRR